MANYIRDIRKLVGNTKIILVVSGALVFDEQGRLLLHKRADNGFWGIPGGYMELGETVQETTRREVWEEMGLHLGQLTLFAVYSGAEYEGTLPDNLFPGQSHVFRDLRSGKQVPIIS